ncbi:MAG: transposase [Myxococcota bacterium]
MAEYERHQPEQTLLHEVVREQLESFLSRARERGAPTARFVERELRAYLDCGVLARGFMRVHCDGCGHDRLVAFSCKGRGFCPSCGGRRMADTAARLVDCVLPEVPVRQWVLTLPYPLRYRCAWDARLTSEVLRAFLRALFADQRRRARDQHGVGAGQCASVTFIQRFGSALNLAPHFHSLVLDGVYAGPAHAPGSFVPLPPPETKDVARVMAGTARRLMRLLEKRRLAGDDDPLASDDPLLATLMAASVRSRIATGPQAGQPWQRLGDRVEPIEPGEAGNRPSDAPPPRCVRQGGMSLHADVAVPARDRHRLERLCRYVARPPLALDRLEAMPDGRLAYRLKTRWRDGTTHILMERRELLERLAPLIPPPRAHQVRYHGILAPCASGRDRVVPRRPADADHPHASPATQQANQRGWIAGVFAGPGQQVATTRAATELNALLPRSTDQSGGTKTSGDGQPGQRHRSEPNAPTESAPTRRPPRRNPWADLLQRVFEIDVLCCPNCGGRMRVLAAITDPAVAQNILKCLALPARAPPIAPAVASKRSAFGTIDQSPEPFGFDQSQPQDWDFGA